MAFCARPRAPRRSSRQATRFSHSSALRACTRSSPCSLSSSFIARSRTAPSPRGRPTEAGMGDLWFCLLAFMGIMYVILDGFDLGAGAIHLVVARSDAERRLVLRSIGPVWDGNEVWLIAAGGTLYFAFPALYAVSFSGFYLPLMIVLWLLVLRGISIELRNHVGGPVWAPFWDGVFAV